jgi:hypothetical protein
MRRDLRAQRPLDVARTGDLKLTLKAKLLHF